MLLYHLATKIKSQIVQNGLPILVKLIVDKKLDTTVRIDVALDYVLSRGQSKESINIVELEKVCGVGVTGK